MFQKVKSSLTSAHCEEWDNEMQNQGRAQALFACLSQALSEEEMPSGENGSALSEAPCAKGWSWACAETAALVHGGSRTKPGAFLPHSLCISGVFYGFHSRIFVQNTESM